MPVRESCTLQGHHLALPCDHLRNDANPITHNLRHHSLTCSLNLQNISYTLITTSSSASANQGGQLYSHPACSTYITLPLASVHCHLCPSSTCSCSLRFKTYDTYAQMAVTFLVPSNASGPVMHLSVRLHATCTPWPLVCSATAHSCHADCPAAPHSAMVA